MTSLEVALRLLWTEAGFILLAGLLGSGAAALIPGKLPAAARVAFAPSLGLAVGFPLMLTASQFIPMSVGAYAVLVPLALLSAGFAATRLMRAPPESRRVPRLHVLGVAVALSLPLALLSAPLIEERSLGPVAYQVSDAVSYASYNDNLEGHAWGDESFGLGRADDLLAHKFLVSSYFQSGTVPFASALEAAFGWQAVDSQSALMIALVAIGALGCFGLVLTITGSAWAAMLAGALYAGPVNYQLFIDGSEAALAALAMLGPIAVAARRLLEAPFAAGALFGLVAVGMMTVYPAFLPPIVIGFALATAVLLIRDRRREPLRLVAAATLAAVAVVVVGPVSLAKNVSYARAVSDGLLNKPADEGTWNEPVLYGAFGEVGELPTIKETFPPFYPPAETAPTWITQTRERYDLLPFSELPPLDVAFRGVVLPLLLVALALAGAWRYREWAFLLLAVTVSLALAYYGYQVQDCSYCGQRALLAIPPILIVFACCGLVAAAGWVAARSSRRNSGLAPAVAALVVLGTALYSDRALAERLVDAGYLFAPDAREVIDRAPGKVLIEGAGAGHPYTSYFESNLLPLATRLATGERPELDWKGLGIAIFPERYPPGLPGDPDYRFVFTRLAGIENDRRVIEQRGPYSLEERVAPLDVTVTNGVVADIAQRDPSGSAWVTGPMTLLLADSKRRPATVVLEMTGPDAASVQLAGSGEIVHDDGRVRACVSAPGASPLRRVDVPLRFQERPGFLPVADLKDLPAPEEALELTSLSARRACPSVFEDQP